MVSAGNYLGIQLSERPANRVHARVISEGGGGLIFIYLSSALLYVKTNIRILVPLLSILRGPWPIGLYALDVTGYIFISFLQLIWVNNYSLFQCFHADRWCNLPEDKLKSSSFNVPIKSLFAQCGKCVLNCYLTT